jgi:hypothetical protein
MSETKIDNQKELLVRIMQIVVRSGVCPDTSEKDWAKLILFAHTRGFLYINADKTTAVCAYRSNSEEHLKEMPMVEDGTHLHVVWAASESDDSNSLLKLMRSYLKDNKDIEDISYHRRNNDIDFRKLNVRKYGKT